MKFVRVVPQRTVPGNTSKAQLSSPKDATYLTIRHQAKTPKPTSFTISPPLQPPPFTKPRQTLQPPPISHHLRSIPFPETKASFTQHRFENSQQPRLHKSRPTVEATSATLSSPQTLPTFAASVFPWFVLLQNLILV
jgi:hypothetical protein